MKHYAGFLLYIVYWLGFVATFAQLTFLDGYPYNWWNWIIVVPINGFLATIWPLYWFIIEPFIG